MAQKRYWNFQDDDSTDALNHWLLGINKSGVYAGFDMNKTAGALVLRLEHLLSGFTEIDKDLNESSKQGLILTNQGVVIKEDSFIDVSLTANVSLNPRIDTIIVEHEYIETLGGATATYSVIQGTASATPVPTALTNPEKQTIIGYLYVPGSFSDISVAAVEWVRNVVPMANELNYTDWKGYSYNEGAKTLIFNNENDNLFFAELSSTYEVQNISIFSKLNKSITIWFKSVGKIISGGNIEILNTLNLGVDSMVTLVSYKKENGKIAWKVVSHFRNNAAYKDEVTKFTNTLLLGNESLSSGVHYVSGTNTLITGDTGNVYELTIANGDVYKNFVIADSPLEEHGDGTILYFRILTPTGSETAELSFVTSSLQKLASTESNTIPLIEGDEFYAIKRGIKWVIVPLSNNQKRLIALETGKANASGPASMFFSLLGTNLVTEPTSSPNAQLYYKDQFKRVHFSGRPIKATGAISIGTVLFTLNSNHLPLNSAPLQFGDIYVSVPKLNVGAISSPTVMLTLRIATNGNVILYDTALALDDFIDLRGISFLSN